MSRTILVIDDDIDVLRFIEDSLKAEDYRVLTTDGGYNGIRLARLHRPDLIILDINLPILDGFRTLEYLRKSPESAHVPVLIFTVLDAGSVRRHLAPYKRVFYERKPLSLDRLHEVIRSILGIKN